MKDLLVWEVAQQQLHGEEGVDVNGISEDSSTDSEHIPGVTNENYRKMCPFEQVLGIRIDHLANQTHF